MSLNGVADIAEMPPGSNSLDAQVQALMADLGQSLRQDAGVSHEKGLAGIAMIAVLDERNVDVNNVAIFQDLFIAWDTVADHVINRGADRFWKPLVVERRWNGCLFVDCVIMTDTIEFAGADPRSDVFAHHFQLRSREGTDSAHFVDCFTVFYFNGHGFSLPD